MSHVYSSRIPHTRQAGRRAGGSAGGRAGGQVKVFGIILLGMKSIRIAKVLSNPSVCSTRQAEIIVFKNRVTLNRLRKTV